MNTEEDDEFERIEAEGLRKRQVEENKRINKAFDDTYEIWKRNEVLEEVAQHFDKMRMGDTSLSFAIFVRGLKR